MVEMVLIIRSIVAYDAGLSSGLSLFVLSESLQTDKFSAINSNN